jgi:hypothetical protein
MGTSANKKQDLANQEEYAKGETKNQSQLAEGHGRPFTALHDSWHDG